MRFFKCQLLILLCFIHCKKSENNIPDVSNVKVEVQVERFEKAFYKAKNTDDLQKLRIKFPYLFPEGFTDSLAISKIKNADEQELFAEVQKKYDDFSSVKSDLTTLFKYINYYFPKFYAPKVITIQTNIDYENRVIYADSILLISLDGFLGSKHPFYSNFPAYIKQNNNQENIQIEVAKQIAQQQLPRNVKRIFVEKIIEEGKLMYLISNYLPTIDAQKLFGYSDEKMLWASKNEAVIWAYFVEKQLLYSTQQNLTNRFIEEAPFSKFYTEQDQFSPGKIGVWIGFNIVKSYMVNNDVSLQQLLKTEASQIFEMSKYKPKK